MPWKRTDPMNERVQFIAAYLGAEDSFTEICKDFEISRKTGYKWVYRYQTGGVSALCELSRAPLSHPHAVSKRMTRRILSVRRKHPRWGPRKLLVILERHFPCAPLRAASTVGEILKRNGMVKKPKRIRRSSPYGDRLRQYDSPNAVWCADFKGPFPVAGERCHPLTISDGFSRYLIRCQALRRPLSGLSKKVFESAFREYGLPAVIRTDNGAPFSTLAPGGLSTLAIWWIRLGIRPERIMPGRPDQNGRHERMHSTLKSETAKPPRTSFYAQQNAFDRFRKEYNEIRPHEALGQKVPSSFYKPSTRLFPKMVPEPDYPSHFHVARSYPNGVISFQSTQWYISGCLKNELIGLEQVSEERWRVYFGPILLGVLDVAMAKERGYRKFGLLIRTDGQIPPRERPKNQSLRV